MPNRAARRSSGSASAPSRFRPGVGIHGTVSMSFGASRMAVFIALLRAVNVGGTGKLPMQDLKAACEKAGLERVSTYIASGNLVFETDKSALTVKTLITQLLRDRFGLTKNHTLIRTPRNLAKVIA